MRIITNICNIVYYLREKDVPDSITGKLLPVCLTPN